MSRSALGYTGQGGWLWVGIGALSLAAASCATPPKSVADPAASAKSARVTEPPRTAAERLAQALRSIPRPEPVLDSLPLDAQARLLARYNALDAEGRASVHADDSAIVESLPLLHLVSGGASPRALFALATTSAGSDELDGIVGLEPLSAGAMPDTARIAIVRALSQRAALNFLRDRAADVTASGKGTSLVSRLVARAAVAVGRNDLVLLARELLVDADPSPDNRLDFARELARAGDPEAAARIANEVSGDARHPPRDGGLSALQSVIESARIATAPVAQATDDSAARLLRARAWLRLGRPADARAVLMADLPSAAQRLDLAAASAEAAIDNPSCPGLPLDVGSAELCALAFRTSYQVKAARALLETAWQSSAGRDHEAIEVYVALAQVLPWLQEAAADLARGAMSVPDGAARIAALRAKIQDISRAAPWLQGLALFLETVRNGAAASGLRNDEDAKSLSNRALTLATNDSSRFTQAGVLAVAATLSHQQDISALLDTVPAEQTVPALRVPRTALQAWSAVTTGKSWRMDAARAELAATMTAVQGSSLERARLVLSVSEADALFDSSQRSYQLLSRVAGQLLSDNIPPDLALRAVLDASGALAHGERFDQAQKLLGGAANAVLPQDLPRARDLLQLIRGYKLVLGVHGASADGLPKARAELIALAADAKGEAAGVWFELWARELQALEADASCAKRKSKVCSESSALRHDARHGLDARLGAAASSVLLRGALPSGSFDAGFRFSIENGLEPLLSFDPAFLAIGLPRFSAE